VHDWPWHVLGGASPRQLLVFLSPSPLFPTSRSVDAIFTPKAWNSSVVYNCRPEFDTHIRAFIPILDLPSFWTFIRARVVEYASPKLRPLVTPSSFCLLSEMVNPPRMASMFSETRRNLETIISRCKIVHRAGSLDVSTVHTFQIFFRE